MTGLSSAPDHVGAVLRVIVEDAREALHAAGLHATEVIRTIPPHTDPSRLA